MATPAQAAAATAGAGSLAAAGAYGITSAVKSGEEQTTEEDTTTSDTEEKDPEPQFKTLSDEASEKYTDKTLGHKTTNKPLLVDYKNTENQKWWDWAFKNKFKKFKESNLEQLNDIFKRVDKEYDEVPSAGDSVAQKTSLNYACHKAYGLKWYDFTSENHLLDNVKLFCTKGTTSAEVTEPEENAEITPVFLKDLTSICGSSEKYNGKFACKNTNKDNLVAPVGKDTNKNEDWWKWSYKQHFLTKKAENNKLDAHFSSVNKPYSETEESGGSNQTALNQACEKVYLKTLPINDDQTKNLHNNITLFCAQGASVTLTFTS